MKLKLTFCAAILIALLYPSYSCTGAGVEFTNQRNSGGNGPAVNFSVRSRVTTQTHQVHVVPDNQTVFSSLSKQEIQKHSHFTTTQWDNFFSNKAGRSVHLLHQVDRNDLFCQFNLYQFPSFCTYIAGLEGYHEAMVGLNHQIMNDPNLAHKLSHVSVKRDLNAKEFIALEAKKSEPIVKQKHENFVRAQQAAIAKQREEIALREKQAAAAIQKQREKQVTATIQAQKEDLTAIVDTAKAIKESQSCNESHSWHEKTTLHRAHAIEKTMQENYSTDTREYTILSETQSLLQTVGLNADDFTQCNGNTIQHVIHKEFVTNLNRTALLNERHGHISGVRHIAESAVEFAHVGIAYNNAGHVKQAMEISNLVSAINDYGWAVVQGVGDGIVNTAHALSHPVDTAIGIVRAAGTVGYYLGKVLYEVLDVELTFGIDPIADQERLLGYEQNIKAMHDAIAKKYQSMSGPEMVRGTIAFGIESYLSVKCLGAAGKFYSHAKGKVVEFTQKIKQGLATAPELLASAEGFEVLVAGEAAETVMLSTQENAASGTTRKVSTTLKTMHEPIAWHELNPALGDLTKIKEAESLLKSIDAAKKAPHPLAILVKNGQKNATSGNLGTARGALYELEVAAQLEAKREKVSKFGEYLGNGKTSRDFDISTQNKLIECKNWNWEQVNVTDVRSKLQQQKLIAGHLKKTFELYSKNPIPESWKEWFIENNIIFHEGKA